MTKRNQRIVLGTLLGGLVCAACLLAQGILNGMPYFGVLHVQMPSTGWRSVEVDQGSKAELTSTQGTHLRKHMQYGPSTVRVILDSGREVDAYYFHCDIRVRRRADLTVQIQKNAPEVLCGFAINGKTLYTGVPMTNAYCLSVLKQITAEPRP